MDYPPPLVTVTANGKLSLQQSYFQSIGDFDKVHAATPHCVLHYFRCYALLSLAIPMWSTRVPSKSFAVTSNRVLHYSLLRGTRFRILNSQNSV